MTFLVCYGQAVVNYFKKFSFWVMSTAEQLKCAKTMAEVLHILNMSEYLPLFAKVNILQASALKLLREADLKCMGIDSCGRQKLLQAIQCLAKNIPVRVTAEERTNQRMHYNAHMLEPKQYKVDDEKFYLQKAEGELSRCKVELNLKRNELARLQKQARLVREIIEIAGNTQNHARKVVQICKEYNGSSNLQQLAINLEYLLNGILVHGSKFISAKQNSSSSSLPVASTRNSHSNHANYRPQTRPPTNVNTTLPCYHSNKPNSSRWYSKILKPSTTQRSRQINRDTHFSYYRPSTSPLRIPSPLTINYCPDNTKYQKIVLPLSAPTSPQLEHTNFVDGLFSKFTRNKTSTPHKQPPARHINSSHQSFVRHSRKKHVCCILTIFLYQSENVAFILINYTLEFDFLIKIFKSLYQVMTRFKSIKYEKMYLN
ncbi:unnamed protein product [Thelazia callipaeda]|uniref:SAM domain-containing protein n=1 Tax=Thelazia callipaeda TaxID=103827 RepID=A0A0N5CVM8_THECL|nr:unnamed protein product [Thelazia callipaeda]